MKKIILILSIFFCFINNLISQSGWFHQNSGCNNDLLSVCFLNVNTGICVGSTGKLLMTMNGGSNWDSVISPTNNTLTSVFILDSNIILASGDGRTIIKSTNSGITWYRITNISTGFNLNQICFPDKLTGYVASSEGVILKSTNSGESWFDLNHPYPFVHSFNSLFFLNAHTGYVVGEGDIPRSPIIKTTNGGLNWVRQESSTTSSLTGVKFINPDTGLISGSFSYIRRTINGGINWIFINNGAIYTLLGISFSSNEIVYMVGGNGAIIKSTNGGLNWFNLVSGTTEHLVGVYFLNQLTGYAVGVNGTILKTTTGGVVGINVLSNELPENFSLKQNYPNPFNPITQIEFSIAKNNSFVKLEVFDNNGKDIGILVNQVLAAGTYKVDFNGGNLASGTYLYRIEVNSTNPNSSADKNFVQTKRMVLLK